MNSKGTRAFKCIKVLKVFSAYKIVIIVVLQKLTIRQMHRLGTSLFLSVVSPTSLSLAF